VKLKAAFNVPGLAVPVKQLPFVVVPVLVPEYCDNPATVISVKHCGAPPDPEITTLHLAGLVVVDMEAV
jgi:hypothetical protein